MTLYDEYIESVSSGATCSSLLTRCAVERHLQDLQSSDYVFDRKKADKAIRFICALRHTKCSATGNPFNLQPWQAFLIAMLFGWRRKDGRLRFNKAYIEVARKNGKSELMAAIALYLLLVFGEPGAEIYSAATKRDQARLVFDAAVKMLKSLRLESNFIKNNTDIFRNKIYYETYDGKFQPLGRDHDSEDGSNPSCAIIDEYHAHKTSELLEVMESGMGSRDNPLLLIITTAGFNIESPCYNYRQSVSNILKGDAIDDHTFACIWTLDEGDEWDDPNVWIKANPNLDISVKRDFLQSQVQQAKNEGPSKENGFKVKNLNIWVNSAEGWISGDVWKSSREKFTLDQLHGAPCFVGMDLATVRDIAAVCLFFPPREDGKLARLLWKFYVPEAMLTQREDGKVNYKRWAQDGHLVVTQGNVIDYRHIIDDIVEISKVVQIVSLGYDSWNSKYVIPELGERGVQCAPVSQYFSGLSEPMKYVERMAYSDQIHHNNNPVMDWMLGNVAVLKDTNGNIKPNKSKSADKIDGVAAMLNAVSVWLNTENEDNTSYYDDNDLIFV